MEAWQSDDTRPMPMLFKCNREPPVPDRNELLIRGANNDYRRQFACASIIFPEPNTPTFRHTMTVS